MRLGSDHTDLTPELPVIERPRLAAAFAFAPPVRVVVLLAPAGYGKSFAVRRVLSEQRWIHYRVGPERTSFARFVRGFAAVVAARIPGAKASFPRAWERALQSGSPEVVLARWFCEHVGAADVDFVIDDLHEAAADRRIAAFIEELVRIRADRRFVITARIPGLLPIPLWMATGTMNRPLDEAELRFDEHEMEALAHAFAAGASDGPPLPNVIEACPVSVVRMLANAGGQNASEPVARSFGDLAEAIFARRTPRQRQFLLSASLLPELRAEFLAGCGWSDWHALMSAMRADAPFMWEVQPSGSIRFHDRFADFLALRRLTLEPSLYVDLAQRAVFVLQRARRYADALSLAVRQQLVGDVEQLLDEHGFQILESGRVDDISEALSALDGSRSSASAVATAIRGYIDARLGRFDTSEAWFALGLARAETEASRVAIALYYAGELMHQFRDDAYKILEPYADVMTLPDALLIDVRSSLAQAYMVADRVAEARLRMSQALGMLDERCAAVLQARVLARAAFVAVNSGDPTQAHRYATRAAPIAIAEGLYDVATSAYTVLYTIAYEIDDDPAACLDYLALVHECGIKSGTVRVDLYTLVATYELYAEAGERERLTELDRSIRAVDVNYATLAFLESFLPARALQAGWAGEFATAHALLESTADRQATPLRKALRWSEVALYAAASGDAAGAGAALGSAHSYGAQSAERTTHRPLMELNCALACWALGNLGEARAWVDRAADSTLEAPRVRAFLYAVRCLLDATLDPSASAQPLTLALAALRDCFFGGIALLIESLPMPVALRSEGPALSTVGAWLAALKLDSLFTAALKTPALEGQLVSWVRTMLEGDVEGRTLRAVLLHWLPRADCVSPRLDTLAARVRSVAQRAVAPGVVTSFGREDDVDARIDSLFAQLSAAAPLMAEHSAAVSAWCTRIARCLGLETAQIAYITRSGLMHDVGKIYTPLAILNAPRRLEPDEWTVMRAHASEGAQIASSVPSLAQFVPIIRSHHERLDGKGYPDGLSMQAIPLATRIVTVADCFNAMIGRRAYRAPMSPVDALGELYANRGTQFDPEVVEAMVTIVMGLAPPRPVLSVP